jgi:hypothetical protein
LRVYFSHPFGGKRANLEACERDLVGLIERYPTMLKNGAIVLVSPLHALGFMYHLVSYDIGMEMCYSLLSTCDILVYNDEKISEGVQREIAYCAQHGIKVMELLEFEIELQKGI